LSEKIGKKEREEETIKKEKDRTRLKK